MLSIDNEFRINKEYLDTIDFLPYFVRYNDKVLGDIMSIIEIDYNHSPDMPPELEGFMFNFYTIDDFADYLENRYSDSITIYPVEDYYVEVPS